MTSQMKILWLFYRELADENLIFLGQAMVYSLSYYNGGNCENMERACVSESDR
jgi:hypothetical protein